MKETLTKETLTKGALTVKIRQEIYAVPLEDIVYLENQRRKIFLQMVNGEHTFYGTFDQVLQELDERFLRCSKSYILNMDQIRAMRNNGLDVILMKNGKEIWIGRTNFLRAKIRFKEYLSRKK